jgi:hypothetical protein
MSAAEQLQEGVVPMPLAMSCDDTHAFANQATNFTATTTNLTSALAQLMRSAEAAAAQAGNLPVTELLTVQAALLGAAQRITQILHGRSSAGALQAGAAGQQQGTEH